MKFLLIVSVMISQGNYGDSYVLDHDLTRADCAAALASIMQGDMVTVEKGVVIKADDLAFACEPSP